MIRTSRWAVVIAALLTVAVVGFVWQSRAPVASSPAAVPAAPSPSPAADSTPAPVPAAVPEEAPAPAPETAPVQTTTPTPPPPPAPIVPPSMPAPAAGRAPNPTVGSPARPRAADTPRTTNAAPAPKPVATPPPPSIPATAPAPAQSPAADRTPAATATTPNTTPVDAPLPPVLAAARAAQLLEQGSQSEKAEDWPAALRYYERARAMDPSLGGLASAAVARVQTQMFADGADAFKRAQQFEALNRVNDAITWYERAVRNLPDSSPEKRTATDRLRVLKAGR